MTPHTPKIPLRKKGFTLIELLIVVGILAILAGIAISVGYNNTRTAKQQFALDTLIKTKDALLKFRSDMGYFPGEGELRAGQLNVRDSIKPEGRQEAIGNLENPDRHGATQSRFRAWSQNFSSNTSVHTSFIFNFWMLFERPLGNGSADRDKWLYNKDTRKGWDGPYIKDDRNVGFYPEGSIYGNYYGIADVFDNAPEAQRWYLPAYKNGGVAKQSVTGAPIRFAREAQGYFLISTGLDGFFGTEDDLRLLVAGLDEAP